MTPATRRQDEAAMLDLLRARYSFTGGNGPRWAFVPKVRSAAGFDASRTCDALAFDLWPSAGLLIHGHEIKCSRADWLVELRDPPKAETFIPYVDRWWIVAAERGIVRRDELPPGWGLMEVRGGKIRVVQKSEHFIALPIPKTFLAAIMRAATRREGGNHCGEETI